MPADATANRPVVRPLELHPAEVKFYKEEGYVVLPNFVADDALDALREEVFEVLEANDVPRESLNRASSSKDKLRQCGQYRADMMLNELINGEPSLSVASQLIGGPARVYLPFTAVKAGGGGGTFHFHQDNNYTQHEPALGSINIWVALVDMTPENGCLQVIPRSHDHQWSSHNSDDGDAHQQIDVDPMDCKPIRMRAGDAVAFTRWTVHGSGPNSTDQPRVAYALQYHRDDVKFLDKQSGEWKRLADTKRWATEPVETLGKA